MLQKLFGAGAIASALIIWFARELIKTAFFDRVLHMVNPSAGLLLEYGPPIALAALGVYLLWRANIGPGTQTPRHMLSIVMMIGGIGIVAVGALIYRSETGHFPLLGSSESAHSPTQSKLTEQKTTIAPSPPLDGTIKLECVHEQFQLPADGKLWELVASDDSARSISFQSHWLSEYAYRERPDIIPTRGGFIDKCRITNFGTTPVFNIKIMVRAEFSEQVRRGPAMTETVRIDTKSREIFIPEVGPGTSGRVDFYAWNHTKYHVSLTFDEKIELQRLGSAERETARLIPAFALVSLRPPEAPLSKPSTPIQTAEPPSLLSLFMTDFLGRDGLLWDATADVDLMTGEKKRTIRLFYKIANDFVANSKFIVFYVPEIGRSSDILNFLAANYLGYFTDVESQHWAVAKNQGASDTMNTKELPFSGRIYVYHEEPYSLEQIASYTKMFRDKGAMVQFRGPDHVLAVWQSIRMGEVKPPPRYEIQDGLPKKVQP